MPDGTFAVFRMDSVRTSIFGNLNPYPPSTRRPH
jgi:hypothetical protein